MDQPDLSALPVIREEKRVGPQHTKPCRECPFARDVTDETLRKGGSPPEVYVGQAWGPFLLSCHCDPTYDPENCSQKQLQCAGAAIFRANIGRSTLLPESLLRCEPDAAAVFATPAELVARHRRVSLAVAEAFLRAVPPDVLLARAFADAAESAKARVILVPKEG